MSLRDDHAGLTFAGECLFLCRLSRFAVFGAIGINGILGQPFDRPVPRLVDRFVRLGRGQCLVWIRGEWRWTEGIGNCVQRGGQMRSIIWQHALMSCSYMSTETKSRIWCRSMISGISGTGLDIKLICFWSKPCNCGYCIFICIHQKNAVWLHF